MTDKELTYISKKIWRYSIADDMFVGIVIASNKVEAIKNIRQYYAERGYNWQVRDITIWSLTACDNYDYGVLRII